MADINGKCGPEIFLKQKKEVIHTKFFLVNLQIQASLSIHS